MTIGVFDGVHRGHQKLIRHAVRRARERGVPCVLLTFDPHPMEVVRPGSHPAQLMTLRRRADLVEALGVDVFCVLPFTRETAQMSAEDFAHQLLVERLHVAEIVVGENFTFGHKAAGTIDTLAQLGERFGFDVATDSLLSGPTPRDETGSSEVTFSSTFIRSCVDAGGVVAAAAALGRPHRLEGIVVRGVGRGGTELGFPTANLSMPDFAAIPADGVYACWFTHRRDRESDGGTSLPAAVSVGSNPTFSGTERTVEAYVLDVSADFYGEHVDLDFVRRLRPMERYDSAEALVTQMRRDVTDTRAALDAE